MRSLRELKPAVLSKALIRLNQRVFVAAILGDVLFFSLYWFAPQDLLHSEMFHYSFPILLEVTVACGLLHRFRFWFLNSRLGTVGWRLFFGLHSTAYSLAWGVSCAYMLAVLKMAPYSISATTTVLTACVVATSAFSLDLLVCLIFLASLLGPLLYVAFFYLVDGQGLAGCCTVSVTFMAYLAYYIHSAEVEALLSAHTIHEQAAALKSSNDELTASNRLLHDTFESVDEIFLTFDLRGICIGKSSTRTRALFGYDPAGVHFSKVFAIVEEKDFIGRWFDLLREHTVPFDSLSSLAPAQFVDNLHETTYRIKYFAMRTQGQVSALIVTLSDITANLKANKATEEAEVRANVILAVSENRVAFCTFVRRALSFFTELSVSPTNDLPLLRQELHNFKGESSAFSILGFSRRIDTLEKELKKTPADHYARVAQTAASEILNEMRAWLKKETQILQRLRVFDSDEIIFSATHMSAVRASYVEDPAALRLVDDVMVKLKAQSLEAMLFAYESYVQGVAKKLHKQVKLEFLPSRENCCLLDDTYVGVVRAMIHIFNNSVDHGIEEPIDRIRLGKPEMGLIQICCGRLNEGHQDFVFVRIGDDGRGIEESVQNKIFDLGFSTRREASEISGQGVGLSALKRLVTEANGTIDVSSRIGTGTTFDIRLPAPAHLIWFESALPVSG